MQKLFAILLGCFAIKNSLGQSCNGLVVDADDSRPIPYATVGFVHKGIGINTNESGLFSFPTISLATMDSFLISSVGYVSCRFPVHCDSSIYRLKRKQTLMSNVFIHSGSTQDLVLNSFSNCGQDFYTSNGSITQIGMPFKAPYRGCELKGVKICKMSGAALFRIRIYNFDEFNGPQEDLVDSIIQVNDRSRHVDIDLSGYNIVIPDNYFFIAIEWIYVDSNADKVKYKNVNGQKINSFEYSPYISISRQNISPLPQNDNTSASRSWSLDFRGKWYKTSWNFKISAIVR